MVNPDPARRERITLVALLVSLTLLGVVLRFWRLGDWSLDSDETFTLRDSLNPRPTNPRPLLYLLNHFLVQPFAPLDEVGLRLLPALFGALAVPVFYYAGRRLIGGRASMFGALLIAVSPLHVYYSQFARYWSLVFLLSAVYPYAVYRGLRENDRRALMLGGITAVLAVLAHPASALLVGGIAVWAVAIYVRRAELTRLWRRRSSRWAVLGVVAILGWAVAAWFVPLLQSWIHQHDTRQTTTEFLLHLPGRPGLKQIAYLLSFVESLTLPLALTGVLGIYLLWRGRDRSLGIYLASMLIMPVAFLALLSFRTPVSTFYLVPTTPIVFLGAGVLLDRLAALDWELRPGWLLAAAVTIIVIAAGAPTLISQYRDGRRYDFRSVARWLDAQLAPGDAIFSDQPKVLSHYLPGTEVQYLRGDPLPLMRSIRASGDSAGGGVLWVVSPAPAHAFRTNPRLGTLRGWIYEHCQLRNTVGVGRVDFRQYHLQVFRCPPAAIGGGNTASQPGSHGERTAPMAPSP